MSCRNIRRIFRLRLFRRLSCEIFAFLFFWIFVEILLILSLIYGMIMIIDGLNMDTNLDIIWILILKVLFKILQMYAFSTRQTILHMDASLIQIFILLLKQLLPSLFTCFLQISTQTNCQIKYIPNLLRCSFHIIQMILISFSQL